MAGHASMTIDDFLNGLCLRLDEAFPDLEREMLPEDVPVLQGLLHEHIKESIPAGLTAASLPPAGWQGSARLHGYDAILAQ